MKSLRFAICFVVFLTSGALADFVLLTVNTERVHIGDQPELTASFADWGTFVGTTWQKNFNIATNATTGLLRVEAFDVEAPPDFLNSVAINGILLGYLPYVGPPSWYSSSAELSVPIGILHSGINTLEITSGYGQGIYNNPTYDDFGVGIVTLSYIPEPTTLLLVGLGGIMLRKRKTM